MKSLRVILGAGVFLFFSHQTIRGQALAVDNVRFVQQPNDAKVAVSYDLIGDPAQKYTVELSLFMPETKETVSLRRKSLSFDAGKDVRPGRGKKIVWDLLKEYPQGLNGEGYVFLVDVYAQKSGGKKVLVWGGLAALAGGGAYYAITNRKVGPKTDPDLPGPPGVPDSP